MMRRTSTLLLLISVSLLLGACASTSAGTVSTTAPTAASLQFADGLGRTVQLSAPAQRIVSLAPSNTEILFALGVGDRMVGRDDFSDTPVEAKSIQGVGGSMGNYDLEAIAQLKPDLVLAAEINTPEQVQALESMGLTVYYLSNPKDLEGMYANLETVGRLTGQEARSGELVSQLRERVSAVQKALEAVEERPVVYYELDATDLARPYTAGPGTFVDQLIAMAGGQNLGAGLGTAWAQVSAEEILSQDPDIILLGDAAYGVTPESIGQRPGWAAVKAVENGRVYPFDDNTVSRPTHRLVDALENLAKLLHPERFQ